MQMISQYDEESLHKPKRVDNENDLQDVNDDDDDSLSYQQQEAKRAYSGSRNAVSNHVAYQTDLRDKSGSANHH